MPGRKVPQKEFRALSEQNVETVASVVCCDVGPLCLSPQDVCVILRKRVWVEEKPLFLGGWLSFLDHL